MTESSGAEGYDPSKDPKRKAKSKDPGWKYGFWPELSDKNLVQCTLCGKKLIGGMLLVVVLWSLQSLQSESSAFVVFLPVVNAIGALLSLFIRHQRLNDLVHVQYNRRIVDRFQKRRELGRNFDPLVLDDFDWGNEWILPEQDIVHDGDDLTWEDVDIVVGASDAIEGRNLPRRTGLFYSRRGNASTSKAVNESDSDVGEEEEGLPNDDENVDDDYGRRVTTVSSDDTAAGRDDDDLMFDDFV